MTWTQKLFIGNSHTSYLGSFGRADMHRHGALVLLVSFSGSLEVTIGKTRTLCTSALIEANVPHIADSRGEYVGTLYFEPDSTAATALRNYYLDQELAAFDIVPRDILAKAPIHAFFDGLVCDLLPGVSNKLATGSIDGRISNAVERIRSGTNDNLSPSSVAQSQMISQSRFSHLFKDETRVSFRRYKLWNQLARFLIEAGRTGNYTQSALESGFYDSAHLNNTFRNFFGITPSSVLKGLDEFTFSR